MRIFVRGIGIISSMGCGYEENYCSLENARCGIKEYTLPNSKLKFPLGRVGLGNGELKSILGVDGEISRTALLGLVAAKEALGGLKEKVAFVNSTTMGGMDLSENFYADYLKDKDKANFEPLRWHKSNECTDFIAKECGMTGFRTTVSTACSSALNSVISAVNLLKLGLYDYVLVGGVDALCAFTINGFNSLKILDSKACRPMDRDRNGLNLGEGAAYLLLSSKADSASCELLSYANANDCYHQTASSPEGNGAFLAMKEALGSANIKPEDIDYINLHGTGTANNDSSELSAISRLFGKNIAPCSSTKSYTGHTLAASGSIGAVYSIMSLMHNILFANLRFENPVEGFDICPIRKNTLVDSMKYAMTNSFGFGGSCSSLIFKKL